MKTEKILQEITKTFLKGECVNYDILDDNSIVFTVDGVRAYVLRENEHCFNIEKFHKVNIKQCFNVTDKHHIAQKTNDMKYIENIKSNVVCISNGDIDVWVNEKYLKLFDDTALFQIVGCFNPVLVYENGYLKGIVMPVKMPKTED